MLEPVELVKNHCAGAAGVPEELLGGAVGCFEAAGVGEGGEHVLGVVAGDAVEVEVGGVEFGAELGTFGVFPDVDAVAAGALEVAGLG